MSSQDFNKKVFFMISGIICEFNPFHKGHKHLIDTLKQGNDDNKIVCVMSGNFVQRGEFAIKNKFERAKDALENGADLVIELPTIYSTLSAQGFAKAGVTLLEATGICDSIGFGAENDNIEELQKIALKIKECDSQIKEELAKGISYPKARQNAVNSPLLSTPNNILAIEYLTYTKLKPIAVKRIGKGHDSDDSLYSASEIRRNMSYDDICSMINCEKAILAKLRSMTVDEIAKVDDVSEGLENRIYDSIKKTTSLEELYDLIKTKRYTHSRIRRIILRAYLSIYNDYPIDPQYIRILGLNDSGRSILKQMKKTAKLPIIMKYSDINKLDSSIKETFEKECLFTDLYNLGYKKPLPCGTEQRSKVVII